MTKRQSVMNSLFDKVILRHPIIVVLCMIAAVVFFAFKAQGFWLDASAETLVL